MVTAQAVPFLDLRGQYVAIESEVDAAVKDVLIGGSFVLGPLVDEFERRVAEFCGSRHGIGVASGTDALLLALTALGVGPGDEVITTPFSFVATASTISHCGATPVFVDIDPSTYNLDAGAVESAITKRTRAIVPVHLYGQPADMDAIMELAGRNGLYVVEDAAQAIGARYHGARAGSIGHAGCLSFYPTKNLGGYGDGGMVVTDDPDLAHRIDMLRRQGSKTKYHSEIVGFNSRLDAIQAAILGVKLNYLEGWNESRRRLAHGYDELLADLPLEVPYESPDATHAYHLYTIRTERRDSLRAYLSERDIGNAVYYPTPLHRQELYKDLGYTEGSLPFAERASREVLSLPLYPELTSTQQERVAAEVTAWSRMGRR